MKSFRQLTLSTVLSLALLGGSLPRSGSAETTRVVCISAGGELTVREDTCLSTETKASMSNLPQKGAKGPTGTTGAGALKALRLEVFSDIQFVGLKERTLSFSFCSDGEVVLSGGCRCFTETGIYCNSATSSTAPLPLQPDNTARDGWRCQFTSTNSIEVGNYTAYAVCADQG